MVVQTLVRSNDQRAATWRHRLANTLLTARLVPPNKPNELASTHILHLHTGPGLKPNQASLLHLHSSNIMQGLLCSRGAHGLQRALPRRRCV